MGLSLGMPRRDFLARIGVDAEFLFFPGVSSGSDLRL